MACRRLPRRWRVWAGPAWVACGRLLCPDLASDAPRVGVASERDVSEWGDRHLTYEQGLALALGHRPGVELPGGRGADGPGAERHAAAARRRAGLLERPLRRRARRQGRPVRAAGPGALDGPVRGPDGRDRERAAPLADRGDAPAAPCRRRADRRRPDRGSCTSPSSRPGRSSPTTTGPHRTTDERQLDVSRSRSRRTSDAVYSACSSEFRPPSSRAPGGGGCASGRRRSPDQGARTSIAGPPPLLRLLFSLRGYPLAIRGYPSAVGLPCCAPPGRRGQRDAWTEPCGSPPGAAGAGRDRRGGVRPGLWLAAVIPLATTAVGVAAWTPQQRRQVLGR